MGNIECGNRDILIDYQFFKLAYNKESYPGTTAG